MAHETDHVETKSEKLARIRANQNIVTISEDEVDSESGLTMADRARLTATGLLFNFADEAIAGVKALSPDVTYDEALEEEREKLKSAQSKEGSLKYEVGGAIIPAVGTTIASVVGAPFTGGTSLAASVPLWARLLGLGAAQGFVMGAGSSEEEGLARVKDTPTSTITGMIANPAFAGLSIGVQKLAAPIIDSVRRSLTGKTGKKVEDELIRIIQDSKLDPEDVIMRIRNGEILPEMSEDAASWVAGFANKAGPGKTIIRDAIVGRKNKFINEVYESLQKDLAPDSKGGNIFKTFSDDADKLKKAESDAYTEIFDSASGQTFQQIDDTVLALANASRNSRNVINKFFDESGLSSPFKMVGKGKNTKLKLSRPLSLEEGELVKRAFMDLKDSAMRSGNKNKAKTMSGYEKTIKNVLDEVSPELQATRKNWAMIENSVKQYDLGKKVFGKNPEEFAVEFQKLVDAGDEDAIEALRSGAASSLKLKSQSTSATGTVTKLADAPMGINQKEREILEILYPGDKIEDIIVKVNQARGSIVASNKVFGGSPTGERIASGDRVGIGQTLADVGRVVASGGTDVLATAGIVTRLFGGKKPPFTNDQYKEIARLVVTEDADLLEAAITDQTKLDALLRVFRKAIDIVSGTQPRVTIAESGTEKIGDVIDPTLSGALSGIITTIKPSVAKKIQDAVVQ
tara:strand:- start:1331 stop:3391 length:2061 start_codon:yes stop_codon:yes gene_type:complete